MFFFGPRASKVRAGIAEVPPGPIDSRRHCATLIASQHRLRVRDKSLCHLTIAR